ncbi:MAG TPA: hypothetical protein VHU88_18225 [Sporichthyaceae bacterium]|nr:hypothetical protein [Sporichthyaceae bacterium]
MEARPVGLEVRPCWYDMVVRLHDDGIGVQAVDDLGRATPSGPVTAEVEPVRAGRLTPARRPEGDTVRDPVAVAVHRRSGPERARAARHRWLTPRSGLAQREN